MVKALSPDLAAGEMPMIKPSDVGGQSGVPLLGLKDATDPSATHTASTLSDSESIPRSSRVTTVQRHGNIFEPCLSGLGVLLEELPDDEDPLGEPTRVLV